LESEAVETRTVTVADAVFVIGLMLDIIGAWFLAQSFVTKRLEDLTFEGTSGYGSPPNLRYIASVLHQKAEAQIGFTVLAFGFTIQALDYFGVVPARAFMIPRLAVVASATFLGCATVGSCRIAKSNLFRTSGIRMAVLVLQATKELDNRWVCRVAKYLLPDLARDDAESDDQYAARIRQYVQTRLPPAAA
jgi:hypothetical protein